MAMLVIIFHGHEAGARKAHHVSAEYSYTVPSNQSDDDAKQTAIQRARNAALIEAFGGEQISQVNSTLITADGKGGDAIDFQTHMQSRVRGVWIKDLKEPSFRYSMDPTTGMRVISVTVTGEAYKLENRQFPCKVEPMRLSSTGLQSTSKFISGDILVINFTAPVNGFCAIYLIDENNNVMRAIPHQKGEGSFRVKADKAYQLLHPETSPTEGGCKDLYSNYEFYCESKPVTNWLCVAFSKKEFNRPPDSLQDQTLKDGLIDLTGVDLNTFNQWALDSEDSDESFSLLRIPVYIMPN